MSEIAAATPDHAAITLADVSHVAELANLELTAEELPHMQHNLNAVLGYIAQLNELDTTGVPAMAQVSEIQVGEMLGSEVHSYGETLRPDTIKPSLDRAAVMASAPETDGKFFKVPKVIER
jgi:aspartyl-tRNA(Asn)/glutamyl-tRNA(Gln) amidotransferase subunit C